MRIEIVGNQLRTLRASLANDDVHTLWFETHANGAAVKVNEGGWEPIGNVVKADEPARFAYISGAKVLAHFYDRVRDRFVFFAEKGHGMDPFVVAYARSLSNSEWESGHCFSDYGDAATAYFRAVNEVVDANDIGPSFGSA